MTSILVQGWRGLSHSYALVNQYQLLEMLKQPGLQLFHEDLPYYVPHWNPATGFAGFKPDDAARIAALGPAGDTPIDVTLRISFPHRFQRAQSPRLLCFATAERRSLPAHHIYPGTEREAADGTVEIVTPSHWSKEGFIRYGFAEAKVHVVPHGIDPKVFYPLTQDERSAIRRRFGLPEDRFVFLNVGMTAINKGLDLLVRAFAVVHRQYPHAVLLLKDARALYPFKADDNVSGAVREHHLDPAVRRAIGVVGDNLDLEGMRQLYGICDGYVSPYRWEAFNLPPLEAAACGLPVLVTQGGPTDEYVQPSFARPIAARHRSENGDDWLEPDLDSLIAGMQAMIEGRTGCDPNIAVPYIAEHLTWAKATAQLLSVMGVR